MQEVQYVGNSIEPAPSEHPIGGELVTKQAQAQEADINTIMAKWLAGGPLDTPKTAPRYGDFTMGADLFEAMQRVEDAQLAFEALPSAVRDYCEQDPVKFLELVQNAQTREEMEKLGLVEKDLPPAIQKVEVVNPAPAPQA